MAERTAALTTEQLPQGADFHIGDNTSIPMGAVESQPQLAWGDLEDRHHLTRVAVLNNAASPAATDVDGYLSGRTNGHTPKYIKEAEQIANSLMSQVDEYHASHLFPSPESDYMAQKIKFADEQTKGLSLEAVTAARLAQFEKVHIATDNDGTLTDLTGTINIPGVKDFKPKKEYQRDLIPGSLHAEDLLDMHSRDNFPIIFSAVWRPLMQDAQGYQLFREAGRYIPIRDGLTELIDFAKSSGSEMTIISQNFQPVIEGIIDQTGNDERPNIVAITPDSLTPDKSKILHSIAKKGPDSAIIFMGDWVTDYSIAEAYNAGIVSAIFALADSTFHDKLDEEKIPHFTFRDLHDIRVKLEEVTTLANQIKAGNAIASF